MVNADRSPGISQYGSVDPAPPSTELDVEKLKHQLLDENSQMFLRMRTVFSLRNNGYWLFFFKNREFCIVFYLKYLNFSIIIIRAAAG